MAKDTYYFPHDYNPTEDEKIMGLLAEYGAAGYGLYWRFVELMHSTPEHRLQKKPYFIVAIAKQMNSTSDFLLQFLDDCVNKFELFVQDHDFIFSERVMRNIDHRRAKTEIAKANGSKGGVAKAKQNVATAKQNVAIKGNESKEKKTKEEKELAQINLLAIKKADFAEEIKPFIEEYGRELCLSFYEYWTEPNKGKSKIKWEMEKTFDIRKRLNTFRDNDAKWNKNKTQQKDGIVNGYFPNGIKSDMQF